MNKFTLKSTEQVQERSSIELEDLLHNAIWFTKIRWLVVLVFAFIGVLSQLNPLSSHGLELKFDKIHPWQFCTLLGLFNLILIYIFSLIKAKPSVSKARIFIWFQICLDLSCLTLLVHLVGSTTTIVAFAYLFHIVLACIVFSPRSSLMVTGLAAILFTGCVLLENHGVLAPRSIVSRNDNAGSNIAFNLFFCVSAIFVWLVVWYLASSLSKMIRQRDMKLESVNQKLSRANEEKNRQMLKTTHDLKAPFSGIETNIQLLKYKYWDDLDSEVQHILDKISKRSTQLRMLINEILTLGHLRIQTDVTRHFPEVRLDDIIDDIVAGINEMAASRNVEIVINIAEVSVYSDSDQLVTLFRNLVSNAISYSHEGGKVEISSTSEPNAVHVFVKDNGIGISPEALPLIFDEYYRSKEGRLFNSQSTGLGLSIVKQVVNNLKLQIVTTSTVGSGTTFEVIIPIIK